jgi:hypothetical protein
MDIIHRECVRPSIFCIAPDVILNWEVVVGAFSLPAISTSSSLRGGVYQDRSCGALARRFQLPPVRYQFLLYNKDR